MSCSLKTISAYDSACFLKSEVRDQKSTNIEGFSFQHSVKNRHISFHHSDVSEFLGGPFQLIPGFIYLCHLFINAAECLSASILVVQISDDFTDHCTWFHFQLSWLALPLGFHGVRREGWSICAALPHYNPNQRVSCSFIHCQPGCPEWCSWLVMDEQQSTLGKCKMGWWVGRCVSKNVFQGQMWCLGCIMCVSEFSCTLYPSFPASIHNFYCLLLSDLINSRFCFMLKPIHLSLDK